MPTERELFATLTTTRTPDARPDSGPRGDGRAPQGAWREEYIPVFVVHTAMKSDTQRRAPARSNGACRADFQ